MRPDITLAYRKAQRGPGPQDISIIFFNREQYSILTVSVTQRLGPLSVPCCAHFRPRLRVWRQAPVLSAISLAAAPSGFLRVSANRARWNNGDSALNSDIFAILTQRRSV
jgi:hypothetical protein